MMDWLLLGVGLSMLCWIYLLVFRGRFWRCDQRLSASASADWPNWPSICAIVPARNEADVLPQSLATLLTQRYPGPFSVTLVDDQSTDGTAAVARQTALTVDCVEQLTVTTTTPLPVGWSGKLWAVHQGVQQVLGRSSADKPDYFLLTDADIQHDATNLAQLVIKAEQEQLDLVSLMVLLRCESLWEKLLIPAFVFFFQKLYPFPWVNHPNHPVAAAAGGCILVKRAVLERVGGIEVIRKALIDDCALAAAVKGTDQLPQKQGRIWLGLTTSTVSLRHYASLATIWDMVARTAFTQLNYSPVLLLGTLVGMVVMYLLPPLSFLGGLLTGQWLLAGLGSFVWGMMSYAYWPTIHLYRLSPLWIVLMPLIGALYSLMTLDSAFRHWRGAGGAWKGRVYPTATVK